jgi:Fe2+ transport system protein FeoA
MNNLKNNLKNNFKILEADSGNNIKAGPENNLKEDPDNNIKAAPGKPEGKNVILLKSAIPGKKYIIDRITGGHGINGRLNAMGIIPKEVITVVFQTWGGPLTIAVKGVRIALGRGITHKIEVSEI